MTDQTRKARFGRDNERLVSTRPQKPAHLS